MIHRKSLLTACVLALCILAMSPNSSQVAAQESTGGDAGDYLTVNLGDTWAALALRYQTTPLALMTASHTINPHRNPAVGLQLPIPQTAERQGLLIRSLSGGLLELAASNDRTPWTLAIQNQLPHPYRASLFQPLLIPGGVHPPREYPVAFSRLALSRAAPQPGQAFALRGRTQLAQPPLITLESQPLQVSVRRSQLLALGATGAFFPPGQPLLTVQPAGFPLWEQPLTFVDGDWTWEQITFSDAAVLDLEEIRRERERLQALWDETMPRALWTSPFQMPIADFVEISSLYGARRSVNGGPYSSYHEGTDFSAFAGSSVLAPAAGVVVLAEPLAIRGGAVILDHGLGMHSGYYHLSAIHVTVGETVAAGELLGEVGSTGRSTGNHLHWDLLVGRTWVDPLAWLDQSIDSWLIADRTTTGAPYEAR